MNVPRIVLAGTSSGVGKTSVTCAVIRAMQKRGLAVRPFKAGPDYIDPIYLSCAARQEAFNLDAWLMGERLLESFVSNSDLDISVIEGVMGYYDGLDGSSDYASTHHVASITKSPVVLVVDASRSARSVAATVLGFQRFSADSRVSGVILNKIGSGKHERLCRDALGGIRVPVLGAIPRDSSVTAESRHLGLISTLGKEELETRVDSMEEGISGHLDMEGIMRVALDAGPLPDAARPTRARRAATIAVALDASFNFYYQDNLEALRNSGASLTFFSPAGDAGPPKCDGMYIGGGFPEVMGNPLERNCGMRAQVKKLAEDGMPIYAECGGLMYLTKRIISGEEHHAMAGVFDAETRMGSRRTLGYTQGEISCATPITAKPREVRGHEFHYSSIEYIPKDARFACKLRTGAGIMDGQDGLVQDMVLASYGHIYFGISDFASVFVENCAKYSRR